MREKRPGGSGAAGSLPPASGLEPPAAHTRRRFLPHAILAATVLLAIGAGLALAASLPLPNGPNDFNAPGFIVRNVWVKFAYLADPFRRDLGAAQKDRRVARYFALNGLIAGKEREVGDPTTPPATVTADEQQLRTLRAERDRIQTSVEVILEGRLTKVIREVGLTRRVGGNIVWPPVDIVFQHPPEVLVTSPRDRIEIQSESLLQGNLSIEKVQQIENKAESGGKTSAAVIQISGIAMYPAIIPRSGDYVGTLQDIAHEWTHHYLFFTPLGRRYFENSQLTTLNETVANMVGRELGARLAKEYPLPDVPLPFPPAPAPPAPSPKVNFNKTMHDLRLRVEALLRQGKIDDAERDMEQTREYLAANGYYIRRINQAYFAFQGSYADTPGSINPIGPKLDQLRRDTPSLASFVHIAQQFTSAAALDRALTGAR
ncbi:MAG: hypothetical protein KGK07_15325 [Chloroflexota bacterium]|nr:hypothetical protein [Chloroflexota bacterium]